MSYRFLGKCKAGMGDVVQLGCVVKHLKHYYPDWYIGIETKPGLSPILEGIADESHDLLHPMKWRLDGWDSSFYFQFERPSDYWSGVPSTKVSECLKRYFPECEPIEDLYRYSITINDQAKARADKWIADELDNKPFALVHPWGTARKENKDLTAWELYVLLGMIVNEGLIPVVLFFDWPVPDFVDELAVCPNHTNDLWSDVKKKKCGNAQVIARLIDRAGIFFGIDSGPAHLAACSPITTDSHIFWVNHHPVDCFDLSGNPHLHHNVDDSVLIPGKARTYFEAHYQHTYYHGDLTDWVEHLFRSVVYGENKSECDT